jgi:hypothetical protein
MKAAGETGGLLALESSRGSILAAGSLLLGGLLLAARLLLGGLLLLGRLGGRLLLLGSVGIHRVDPPSG